jgi:hypothetical protein
VFPLPPGQKDPPPTGYTGWKGEAVSPGQLAHWKKYCLDYNVGLHLPAGVLGVDVDAYGRKKGDRTLHFMEDLLGPLPVTWMVTARPVEPGNRFTSGIRLFLVPDDLVAPNLPWIEMIHVGHRYAVVWGSIHPDLHRPYCWYVGAPWRRMTTVPVRSALPELPEAWVDHLAERSRHRAPPRPGAAPSAVDSQEVQHFVQAHTDASHPHLFDTVRGWAEERVASGIARHDAYRDAVVKAAQESAAGFYDAGIAFATLHGAFIEALSGDRPHLAEAEWCRIACWAVGLAAGIDADAVRDDVLSRIEPGRGWGPGLDQRSLSWAAPPAVVQTPSGDAWRRPDLWSSRASW